MAEELESYEHEFTDEPVCPHCGATLHFEWESIDNFTGDFAEWGPCSECGKKLTAMVEFNPEWTTAKADGEAKG